MALREASLKMCSLDDFLKVAYAWSAIRTILTLNMIVFDGDDDLVFSSFKGKLAFSREEATKMRFVIDGEQMLELDLSKLEIAYLDAMKEEDVVIRNSFRLRFGAVAFFLHEEAPVANA